MNSVARLRGARHCRALSQISHEKVNIFHSRFSVRALIRHVYRALGQSPSRGRNSAREGASRILPSRLGSHQASAPGRIFAEWRRAGTIRFSQAERQSVRTVPGPGPDRFNCRQPGPARIRTPATHRPPRTLNRGSHANVTTAVEREAPTIASVTGPLLQVQARRPPHDVTADDEAAIPRAGIQIDCRPIACP